jgi:hypothetical protein
LPNWLRDSVGIAKLTLALLLLIGIGRERFALVGALGLALLMVAAVSTHVRVRNPVAKMLPALTLLAASVAIAGINYRLLAG